MNKAEIRALASRAIRDFVWTNAYRLNGRVLDYGCGLPHRCVKVSPYREYVGLLSQAEYVPYDVGYPEPVGHFDIVLMTQVIQFIDNPLRTLALLDTDMLVMTYSTCWEEVEDDDLWRFTKRGMDKLVRDAGFRGIPVHEPLWSTPFEDFKLVGGYGIVCVR